MTPTRLLLLGGLAVLCMGATEQVTGEYRAVTLEVGQRRQFRVAKLETVTGSSGRCIEEGLESGEAETIFVEASCAGVRTSLVWRTDGTRVHVMACAEDPGTRTDELLRLRRTVEGQLKALKSVTACVRNGRVELWGWIRTDAEAAQLKALERRFGVDSVRSLAERLEVEP